MLTTLSIYDRPLHVEQMGQSCGRGVGALRISQDLNQHRARFLHRVLRSKVHEVIVVEDLRAIHLLHGKEYAVQVIDRTQLGDLYKSLAGQHAHLAAIQVDLLLRFATREVW